MLQRKQTIFLLIAVTLCIICLCFPIGFFEGTKMGDDATLYNLWLKDVKGGLNMQVSPLFFLLMLTSGIGAAAIFNFRRRMAQARLCVFCILLVVVWYAVYAYVGWMAFPDLKFTPHYMAALPLVSIVFFWLARRGIIADEKLVRSVDRIR